MSADPRTSDGWPDVTWKWRGFYPGEEVTDPRTLADRLDREADLIDSAGQRHRPHADDLRAAAVLLRDHAALLAAIGDPVGVDYCTLHDGIRNEDDDWCDFHDDDPEEGPDGEPRQCVLVPLVPMTYREDIE